MRAWTPVPASSWPDGLILYDGVCVLCSRWVRMVIERDPTRRFSFASIQSPYGRALASVLEISPEAPETNALMENGRALFKSDAVIAVLSRIDGFGWTQALRAVPRPIRDFAYDRIANNRYVIFGRTDACFAPSPKDRSRFLDASPPPAAA